MVPYDWTKVESTNIQRVKFDRNKHDACGILSVEFNTGKVYTFNEVPEFRAEGLLHASSPFGYYQDYIAGRFKSERC